MPTTDRPVTRVTRTDLDELLHPVPGRRQALPGFDDEFVDIADYIIRITWRIWEGGGVERIRDYYENDVVIHTPAGVVRGVDALVQNTRAMQKSFPDRTLWGDNVIWSNEGERGFYSSHRITSHMTNLGASEFGPATGRRATVVTIADCAVKENRIFEEWLVRDNLSLVWQLGFDPFDVARRFAASDSRELRDGWRAECEALRAQPRAVHPHTLPAPDTDPEEFAATVFHGLWCGDAGDWLSRAYSPVCRLHAPSGRELFGHGEIQAYLTSVRATLHDIALCLDHVSWIPCGARGLDLALRWRLTGLHQGDGLYGAATGQPVLIAGISQWRIVAGRVCEEWTVFDELSVLRQLRGAGL